MDILSLLLYTAAILFFILFFPDIFPICRCCGKIKFRLFFKIHLTQKLKPGYSSSKSICSKCCNKYSISDLYEYNRIESIMKKVEIDIYKNQQSPDLPEQVKNKANNNL